MILPAIPAYTAPSFDSYPRTTRLNFDCIGNTGPLPVDNKFSSTILSSNYLNENPLFQPIPVHTNEFLNQRDLKLPEVYTIYSSLRLKTLSGTISTMRII